jgi:hypothetical protein
LTHNYIVSDLNLVRIRLFAISSSKLARQIQDIMERKPHELGAFDGKQESNTMFFLINVLAGMDF